MEFEEIAKKAYKKEKLSEYASLPEQYAYLRLKVLYEQYKYGDIQQKDAEIEKNCIRKNFEGNMLEYNRCLDVYKTYHKNKIDNNNLIHQIDISKDKEEIFELALKAVGFFICDDYFAKRNIEKFK